MSERLSDMMVANLASWIAAAKATTSQVAALAREVQEWRKLGASPDAVFQLIAAHQTTSDYEMGHQHGTLAGIKRSALHQAVEE